MDVLTDILNHKISINDVQLDGKQKLAVRLAMIAYGNRSVEDFRAEQEKSVKLEAIKLFPALWKRDIVLWLRKRSFLKSCKQAQIHADTSGYKTYVVRSSQIAYILIDSLDVRHNKQKKVFGKNVDAIKLEETASFTATRKIHPPVVKRN